MRAASPPRCRRLSTSGFENGFKCRIVHSQTLFFDLFVLLQKFFAGLGQAGAGRCITGDDPGLEVLFRGANFTPGRLVGHFHLFGGLIDGPGLNDVFKQRHPAFGHDNLVMFINDTL